MVNKNYFDESKKYTSSLQNPWSEKPLLHQVVFDFIIKVNNEELLLYIKTIYLLQEKQKFMKKIHPNIDSVDSSISETMRGELCKYIRQPYLVNIGFLTS